MITCLPDARVSLLARVALILGVVAAGSAGSRALAQEKEPPKPPPKSVEIQVFVILASKGEVDYADPSLKELAELLKRDSKGQFNRFRLHKSPQAEVKLSTTTYFGLIENYHLKATYSGVKAEQPEMVQLSLSIVRREQGSVGGKDEIRETPVLGPLGINIVRDKFVLIGGPQIGDDKLILAVRVLK